MRHEETSFLTPSETVLAYDAIGTYDVPDVLTWADTDRDLTAWTGNEIQRDALAKIYALEADVLATGDQYLIEQWRKLQTSDHFYYMCTKWSADGDVHAYFSPYQSPYDAYIAFMNALSDLQLRVKQTGPEQVVIPTPVSNETVVLELTLPMLLKSSWQYLITESSLAKTWKRYQQRLLGSLKRS